MLKKASPANELEQICLTCRKSLIGHRYIVHQTHSYCVPCYESEFSNTCVSCHALIGTDCKDLAYKDKHWHDNCFVCVECKTHLLDKMFAYRNEQLFCSDCYDKIQAMGCEHCTLPFNTGTKKYEYQGKKWHEQCFNCYDCKAFIGSSAFIYYKRNPVCLVCYDNKYALHCAKCQKVISKGGLLFKDTPWHMDCFTCSHCDKQLAGDKFTTQLNKQYCLDCYCKLFADKCSRCQHFISGLGGVKFVSFEDRTWHCKCFTCFTCGLDLVGQGFVVKENEIVCAECGKRPALGPMAPPPIAAAPPPPPPPAAAGTSTLPPGAEAEAAGLPGKRETSFPMLNQPLPVNTA